MGAAVDPGLDFPRSLVQSKPSEQLGPPKVFSVEALGELGIAADPSERLEHADEADLRGDVRVRGGEPLRKPRDVRSVRLDEISAKIALFKDFHDGLWTIDDRPSRSLHLPAHGEANRTRRVQALDGSGARLDSASAGTPPSSQEASPSVLTRAKTEPTGFFDANSAPPCGASKGAVKGGRPSDTAEAMAAARAIGSHVYGDMGILSDPFAEHFLGPRSRVLYRLVRRFGVPSLNRALASAHDRILPGSVGWVLTRHRYFDDAIEDAARHGAAQFVLIGAGYDSRAFRQKALSKLRVFEVDHPDTQARKKRIVQQVFGDLPRNVVYVSLDATQGDLRKLLEYGFDRRVKAVFVLEGFLWYMPAEVARAILAAIVEIAAPGSQVIFDFILPSVVDGSCALEGAPEHRRYCERRGEPILFGIAPEQLEKFLHESGLRLIDDVAQDTLKRRYTAGSGRDIKVYPFLRIARAEVNPRV
jgi:methyltransferase (TIGR00027 family)